MILNGYGVLNYNRWKPIVHTKNNDGDVFKRSMDQSIRAFTS